MATVRMEQAGREYTVILSNNGVRVEFGGAEIFRHWPDVVVNQPPTLSDGSLSSTVLAGNTP
ncbi:MAG: hypothetical protein ACRCSU_07850 [Paracoccaceae bacterium]